MHTISGYRGNGPTNKEINKHSHKPTNPQTGPIITIHCAAKLSAQCNASCKTVNGQYDHAQWNRIGYIIDAVTPVSREPSRNRLRSAATTDFIIPRTRTKLGETAFSVSGPTTWNSLPQSLRKVDCIATSKRQLKTHYFNTYLCRQF